MAKRTDDPAEWDVSAGLILITNRRTGELRYRVMPPGGIMSEEAIDRAKRTVASAIRELGTDFAKWEKIDGSPDRPEGE